MKILSMTATFGALERQRLELGEGLNILSAPNEGGKSTWAAFLKAMLYGIDTRDRDRKGHLADKNRYQPWSGLPMEGELELLWQGRRITLRRGPRGSVPFGAFSAVYTDSGEPVEELSGANCGETLLGVSREVFERTAFVGQGGGAVTTSPELERRIAALASSGEEDVSYAQAEKLLRSWLNRRRLNRTVGLLPKLEEELREVEEQLARCENTGVQINRVQGELERCRAARQALAEELELHRRLELQGQNQRYARAREEQSAAERELAALEQERQRLGGSDREALKRAQGELSYLKVLEDEIRQAESELRQVQSDWERAAEAARDDCFPDMTGAEGEARAQADAEAIRTAQAAELRLRRRRLPALLGCLVLGLGAGGGLLAMRLPAVGAALALGAALGLAALLWAGLSRSAAAQEQQAQRLLRRYGVQTPQEAEGRGRDFRARAEAAQRLREQLLVLQGAVRDRQARRDNSRSDLLDFVHTFAPQVTDLFGCSAAISRALNLEERERLARTRLEGARQLSLELERQGADGTALSGDIRAPQRSRAETEEDLAAVTGEVQRLEAALHSALGQQQAQGDPAALSARREELEEARQRREEEYQALTLAMSALSRANGLMRERYSPQLNRQAGAWFERLTGGRYAAVKLDRTLEAWASAGDNSPQRTSLSLSKGTVEQLYLAVRLAVCQLCLDKGEKAPLVLDDALADFDDTRCALALSALRELGGERQVLLFTCHSREAALAEGWEEVRRCCISRPQQV